jgi:hypothetical protein
MQIGAGLRARGSKIRTAHPVEVVGLRSSVVGCSSRPKTDDRRLAVDD